MFEGLGFITLHVNLGGLHLLHLANLGKFCFASVTLAHFCPVFFYKLLVRKFVIAISIMHLSVNFVPVGHIYVSQVLTVYSTLYNHLLEMENTLCFAVHSNII